MTLITVYFMSIVYQVMSKSCPETRPQVAALPRIIFPTAITSQARRASKIVPTWFQSPDFSGFSSKMKILRDVLDEQLKFYHWNRKHQSRNLYLATAQCCILLFSHYLSCNTARGRLSFTEEGSAPWYCYCFSLSLTCCLAVIYPFKLSTTAFGEFRSIYHYTHILSKITPVNQRLSTLPRKPRLSDLNASYR